VLGEVTNHGLDGFAIGLRQFHCCLRKLKSGGGAAVTVGQLTTETVVADAPVSLLHQKSLIPAQPAVAEAGQEDLVDENIPEILMVAFAHQILQGGVSSVGRTIRAL
jgi:hypothetical protein